MQESSKENFSINKRILQFIDYLGISRYKFSQETGISEVNILNIYKGKNKPSIEFLEKILNKYKVLNPAWLLTGEGEMLRTELPDSATRVIHEPVERYRHKADVPVESVRVPLYNIEAIAGVVAVFDHLTGTDPIAYLEIPNLPKCDGAVYMVGDSMYPLLKSGDIIIYKQLNNIQNILWGEMYLLSIVYDGDSYITVKYVKQSATPGYVTLVSYNEHHQPKDFPIDSIRFAALVKASVRINSMG